MHGIDALAHEPSDNDEAVETSRQAGHRYPVDDGATPVRDVTMGVEDDYDGRCQRLELDLEPGEHQLEGEPFRGVPPLSHQMYVEPRWSNT